MADPISAAVTAIVTSAASATASAALAITGSATFAAAAGNFVLSLASWQTALSVAGFAASFLLTPKVGFEGSPLTWRADVNAGVPFILGRRATAGSIGHRDEWGANNRYNTVWSVYSGGGPINSFGQYYLEDVATTFNGTNGTPTSGDYVNKAWLQTTTGSASPGALAQTGLDAATPGYEGWSGSSIMPYRAASMITFVQDSKGKSYPAGEPNKRVTIEGLLCYDPRLDSTVPGGSGSHRWSDPSTWTYSENPALCGLKVAMGIYEGSKLVGGVGAGEDGVDLPAFMEWANVCDVNGWVLSAHFTSKDDPHQVLQACMQAGGARYARKGGKISVIARTPKTSVLTIAADDTAGPFELVLNADRLQKVNTVIPRCPQESLEWEVSPQSEVAVSSYVTADGGAIERDIDYPFVALKADGTNRDQPAQLAAYAIVDSREPFSGTIPLKPWCADIEPGDVFTVTEPGFLLDGVELLCVRRQFDPNTNVVNVTFISESSGKHTFALGETNTPPTAPTLTTPDIFTVDAPDVAAFSAVAGTGAQPSIVITADADQINARAFIIDIRIDGVGDWQTFGQYDIETTDVTLTGLEPSTVYEVGIRYVSEFGVVGARLSLGTITTGASVATSISDGIGGSIEWPTIDTRFDDVEADAAAAQAEIDAARDTLDNTAANLGEALATEQARLNTAVDAAQDDADDAQAEIDAARDTLDNTALNLGAALATEQTRINTAVDDARDEARVQISRLSAPKDNLVLDALFSMGSRDWRLSSGGSPTVDERSSPRALFIEFDATGTGEAVSARLLDEFVTEEGERLEIAAEADIDGVATNAVIRVVWLNSAGSSLSTSEVTLTDLFTRGGGFVTAPTNAVKMRLEIAVDATGAGAGSLRLRRPMWRKADDGQTVLTAFSDEDSAIVSRLVRESIIGSEVAAETRRLQTSDGQNFAAIENIEITQTDDGSALAAQITAVEARTTTAEAEIDDLQEAVVVGNLAQARDIQSLKIITRGLNAFDDPTFATGVETWTSTPVPPTVDETGTPRAIEVIDTAAAAGVVATITHGEKFRVDPDQGLELAADFKFSGSVTSMEVIATFFDDSEVQIGSPIQVATGGGASYARVGGFTTAPTGTKYAQYSVQATGGTGAFSAYMRRPHFGGQADGQTELTAFDATLRPRTAEALRGLQVDAWRAVEEVRLSVSDGKNQADIVSERETRVANEAAFASQLAAVETTANGALPESDFDTFFTSAVATNQLQSASDVNASIAAIDLTTYATFTAVQDTADAALPSADFDATFATAVAAANLTSTADVTSAITAFDLSLNATFEALSDTVDDKANSSDVYTTAQADQRFLLQADDGGSLAGYDLTLNTDFTGLQATATQTVRQDSTPTISDYKAGDVWIDTNASNKIYVHDGSAWVPAASDKADLSDVYTQAQANQRFLLQSDDGGSLAGYDLTLNTDFTGLQADVNARALASDVYTQAQANNRFLLQSDDGGSLAGYDLTLNTDFTGLQADVNARALASDVYTQAQANQRFLLQSDDGGSLAGYDLTLNTDFTSLQSDVDDRALASNVFTKAEANNRFLLQSDDGGSLAGYDLTLNTDFANLTNAAAEVIYQAAEPTPGNYKTGDIWVDTDNNFKTYVHNGLGWQQTGDDKANLADVYTQAQANNRFLLQSDDGGSLAGYDLTLNTQFSNLQSDVDDRALASNVFTKAEANNRFLLQSDDGGSLAGYDLTLNTDFTGLQDDVDDRALASNVFTKAEANARFLLQSDDGGSLAGYDLTLNTQFSNLASSAAEVVRQAAEPTPGNYKSGDIWIDSDDGSLYVHNGTAWVFANLATQAWANLNFFTASEVDAAIGAYEITVGATTGTIQSQVSTNATAITDINGNLTASYSLTVDGNGRIAGLKLLSDGTTATVAFAADEFRVSDGVTNFVPFEIVSGQVNLQNVSIDGVDINVASVPGSAITVGDVGVNYLHVDSFHDWYSTTTPSSPWYSATNFEDFDFTGDTVAAEPGDRIELLLTYDNVAVLNAYEQFTFQDTMFIEIAYSDGSTGIYHPADETKERYALAGRNVGVPPGTAGQTQITDGFIHRKVINTDSGFPWVRTGPSRTMTGVRIRVQIEARNSGSTGSAVHGGTRSETYVRNSSKLVDVVMSVDVKKQGPINNI